MLKSGLITEFIEKNKIPLQKVKNKTIGCIEHSQNVFRIRFPGAAFGLNSFFLSGSYLYGFKINLPSFQKLIPLNKHQKNCFHISETFRKPEDLYLNKSDLKNLTNLLSPPQKKIGKEKVFFLIHGQFTLKSNLIIETKKGKEEIQALILNMDPTVNFIKNLCKKTIEENIIKLFFGLDIEFLSQAMLDLFQDYLWQNTIKYYKNIPIYKITFFSNGKYKINDFGKI